LLIGTAVAAAVASTGTVLAASASSRRFVPKLVRVTDSASTDPWNAYETAVMPASGVQVASARTGFALSGEPTNGFDGNLSAPGGFIVAWPSPAVLVTHDGARRWTRSLSVSGGFWGIDALDASHAWAIGVTGLYRTIDGGVRWQRAEEPRKTLVRVAFASARTGYGLTLTGQLVVSNDAGWSWRASGWSGHGSGLCAPKPGIVVVAGQHDGSIWRSGDGGKRWRKVAAGFAPAPGFSPWYADLSCQGANEVELSQAFCQNTVEVCGTEVLSRVRQTTTQALSWRPAVTQSAADPDGGGVHTQPATALSLPIIRATAVGAGGLCLLGNPFSEPASAEISCTAKRDRSYRKARIPTLPLPASKSSVAIQGVDFLNAKVGWALLDEYTASSQPNGSHAKTEIWTTQNGARIWHATNVSPSYSGAWCSIPQTSAKLHIYVCWKNPLS